MTSENDSILYRRLPASGFRRDNTVRSSLRMLSNRWKQSTKATIIKKDETRSSELILPFRKWCDKTDDRLKSLENVDVFMQQKAEIKLTLPMDKELFNQRTSMFLMNSNLKLLKRSMSLKNYGADNDKGMVQRTATIRKGSVWANSTSSKINRFLLFSYCRYMDAFQNHTQMRLFYS